MTLADKPALIATITSIEELDGYKAEAAKRGITPEETYAIAEKRRELVRRKR